MREQISKIGRRVIGRRCWTSVREAYYCFRRTYRGTNEYDFMDEMHYRRLRDKEDDPRLVASRNQIARYRNIHKGQRCFIVGNGPSLNRTDLTKLKDEVTFGSNRIYLMQERNGFLPTYYVSVNANVIEQFSDDIGKLKMPVFLDFRGAEYVSFNENVSFMYDPWDGTLGFSTNVAERVWAGSTVTFTMLQLAYFMGFTTVILVGVDHSFVTQGQPHSLVQAEGDDPNHFDASYFGKGVKWQLPDLDGSALSYSLAKHVYQLNGRSVIDATIGGALQVFEKVDYDSLFTRQP